MDTPFTRRILHVDLTAGRLTIETPPESFYRTYLGGSAMGLYYILQEHQAGRRPARPGQRPDPDGQRADRRADLRPEPHDRQRPVAAGGRHRRQPVRRLLPGRDELRRLRRHRRHAAAPPSRSTCGCTTARPSCGRPKHLWGKTTSQVDDLIKQELGDDKVEIAQCGPAGEKLVRLAAIMNMANRANGRTGMGAVMGSKNLKAVVVRGTSKKLPWPTPRRSTSWRAGAPARSPSNADVLGLQKYGTASVLVFQNAIGSLPTFNYNAGQFDGFEAISGETMTDTILKEQRHLLRLQRALQARGRDRVRRAGRSSRATAGRSTRPLSTFGSYCGVSDLAAISLANKICNEYGLDTIGTGATVAWAMECFEHGPDRPRPTSASRLPSGTRRPWCA